MIDKKRHLKKELVDHKHKCSAIGQKVIKWKTMISYNIVFLIPSQFWQHGQNHNLTLLPN